MISRSAFTTISAVFAVISVFGCRGGSASANSGSVEVSNSAIPLGGAVVKGAIIGTSCKNNDPNQMCIGLKYVAYQSSVGKVVVSEPEAIKVIAEINQLWKQCDISFQVDEYLPTPPPSHQLSFNPANSSEMDDIRKTFGDSDTMLVVTTGSWDRSGSLGNTGANAWTSMPGEVLHGAVLESSVATFSNIIAHELGHYLDLDHVSDDTDLMNPIIGKSSKKLTQRQCSIARESANKYWHRQLRR